MCSLAAMAYFWRLRAADSKARAMAAHSDPAPYFYFTRIQPTYLDYGGVHFILVLVCSPALIHTLDCGESLNLTPVTAHRDLDSYHENGSMAAPTPMRGQAEEGEKVMEKALGQS